MSAGAVSLAEVLGAAAQGRAPIAPETAGYFALGLADLLVEVPVRVDEASCGLTDEGIVVLAESARTPTTAVEAERAVRRLLARMLDLASGGAAPALAVAADRAASAGVAALVREIEAALIPVNRGAARRALARLARETLRAKQDGPLVAPAARPRGAEPQPDRTERIDLGAPDATPVTSGAPFREDLAPTFVPPSVSPPPAETEAAPAAEPARAKGRADELLARFTASDARTEHELARDLKRMAGLEPTPPPPASAAAEPTPSPGLSALAEHADASGRPAPAAEPTEPPVELEEAIVARGAPRRRGPLVAALLLAIAAAAAIAWRAGLFHR